VLDAQNQTSKPVRVAVQPRLPLRPLEPPLLVLTLIDEPVDADLDLPLLVGFSSLPLSAGGAPTPEALVGTGPDPAGVGISGGLRSRRDGGGGVRERERYLLPPAPPAARG